MIPALSAGNLVAYSIQIAVVVLIGGACIRVGRLHSPGVRLASFRMLLVVCLCLPFAAAGLPAVAPAGGLDTASATTGQPPTATANAESTPAATTVVTPDHSARVPADSARRPMRFVIPSALANALVLVLLAGIAARLAWLAAGLAALARLKRNGERVQVAAVPPKAGGAIFGLKLRPQRFAGRPGIAFDAVDNAVNVTGTSARFLISDAVSRPVTFGALGPVVLLPRSFSELNEAEQLSIACHELLHVRRRDWLHTIAEELLRAVFWFHPAVWWLLRQVDLCREQVVDRGVVALTERRQPYVSALVRLALSPVGPVLRPASLFLGRAHLLERVALLSREVSMSTSRTAVSLLLAAAVLVFGGRLVVQAFPLTAAAPEAITTSTAGPPLPQPAPASAFEQSAPESRATAAAEATGMARAAALPAQDTRPPSPPPPTYRAEPTFGFVDGESGNSVVFIETTVDTSGTAVGRRAVGWEDEKSTGSFRNASVQAIGEFTEQAGAGEMGDRVRAATEALNAWRFSTPSAPVNVLVGFNFARTAQSGSPSEPVKIGGAIRQPAKIHDVKPVYPPEAYSKATQGVVILELIIDGAGIPISAYALRPIEGLTQAAMSAALRWRFEPDSSIPRKLMTVTVNFTLGGTLVNGRMTDSLRGGVAGGVPGGVVGGVSGGVSGGVQQAIPSGWPTAAIRVGGEIKQPTKIRDVKPVYPQEALDARVQGVVILEVLIGTDGRVEQAKVLRSIPMLDQAALDAVHQWEFTPTLLNGTPVPVIMTTTVNFTLQ